MGLGCSRCGCSDSRHSSRAPSSRGRDPAAPRDSRFSDAASWDLEREEAMTRLREEFKKRPTVFLLSQIMMSVQFFKDFDMDRLRILQLKQERDDELDKSLQKDKKSAAYLGSPYEVIGEVMAYCRADGDEPCLGHDLDYLIMHDSIAVRTPSEEVDPEEEAKDYQFVMQKCKNEGYTRLRLTGRIRPPTSSHRSHRSNRQSWDWQRQPRLPQVNDETETEPGDAERSPPPSGHPATGVEANSGDAASPTGLRQDGGAGIEAKTDDVSVDDRRRVSGSSTGETRADVHHTSQTQPTGGSSRDQRGDAKSGGSTPEATPSRGSSRDSLSEDSGGSSSSSISSSKERIKAPAGSSTNQGKGQQFMEKLKRKMDGDNSARVDLSDEEQADGNRVKNKASEKPIVIVTDESGTTDAKPSTEPNSGSKPTAAAAQQMGESQQQMGGPQQQMGGPQQQMGGPQQQMDGPQHPTQYPSFHGQMFPGGPAGFPAVNGMPMYNIPGAYQQALPGQGAHTPGQGVQRDQSAHFPGHLPAQSASASLMGVPGPFPIPGAIPGYPDSPDSHTPFPMHPAVPHYFPLHPGMNPYQQFAGMYALPPQSAGWLQGQPGPGDQQPYLPGVPLANQNPAVGFGMPGFPGQPVTHGYPFMFAAPPPPNPLGTIPERPVAGKSPRRAPGKSGGARPKDNHLAPPRQYNSSGSILDVRRASIASSTSRFSVMQDTTTTDEEPDAPGLVPHNCFRRVRVSVDAVDDDEEMWRERRYETHRFLSSERFLGVFADRFGELVRLMRRDAWLQHGGRGMLSGPVVMCREQLRSGLRTTARVTATLLVATWPSEQAFEWALRKRPEHLDMRRKMRYVWPPQRVVQCILQEVGCNLVPVGSRGTIAELEWEIAFQQAEIKLISSLDLVHVHSWAVAKLFFTHFLNDFGCLQERHIRHLMFWQFENNFRDWHLESLGATLVELIGSLKDSVRLRRIDHYFIRKRNLLQNETSENLVNAQDKLQRVMENLLPNVIILMNRLQVRNEAFPTFDWQNLYDTLRMSTAEIMKKLIPELNMRRDGDQFSSQDSLNVFNPHEQHEKDEDDGWNKLTKRQEMEAAYRRWQGQQQKQQKQKRKQVQRAATAPGTPMPVFAGPRDKLHTLGDRFLPRTEMVLCLFIRHFSAMAERLIDHKSIHTALTYVDHSLNLCTLLSEEGASQTADELREKLVELHAAAIAELPPPEEEVPQVDLDLLPMTSGGGAAPEEHSNWTVGHAKGRAMRRDFNREAAAEAAAGDEAEWRLRGGSRPETEGRDGSSNLFGGSAILGEMRINPGYVEDQPEAEDDDVDGVEVVADTVRTSRGEADGSADQDESLHDGQAVGRRRSGLQGSDRQLTDEEDDEGDDEEDDEEDEANDDGDGEEDEAEDGGVATEEDEAEASGIENGQSPQEEDEDIESEDTQM